MFKVHVVWLFFGFGLNIELRVFSMFFKIPSYFSVNQLLHRLNCSENTALHTESAKKVKIPISRIVEVKCGNKMKSDF